MIFIKKINEFEFEGSVIKGYETPECSVVRTINDLQSSDILINQVVVREFVEKDMKSVHGSTFTPDEFLFAYDKILTKGLDLSFELYCLYEGVNVVIGVSEDTQRMSIMMSINNSSIELDEMFEKK